VGATEDAASRRPARPGDTVDHRERNSLGSYFGLIWYFETQSFTVAQSMLSKKASM
jgi:hypothetical protein